MEQILEIIPNADKAKGALQSIQSAVAKTTDIIKSASSMSTLSFGQMAESLSRYSSAMWENSNAAKAMEIARTAMGVADEFAANGVRAGIDSLLEHIGAMTDNEAVTIGLETVRNAMGVADEFAANGVRAGIESLLEHIGAMTDNEAVTVGLEAMRSAMSAADFLA
ncbi:MAG: hypothetical protein LBU60_06220, partial [Clostridiales bacterium]|nr:hypothetical protein [Clostridiales bacterium]